MKLTVENMKSMEVVSATLAKIEWLRTHDNLKEYDETERFIPKILYSQSGEYLALKKYNKMNE